MTDSEKKVQEIIDEANKVSIEIYKESTSELDKHRLQVEFLKVHLKSALDTIEWKEKMAVTNDKFYTQALNLKTK